MKRLFTGFMLCFIMFGSVKLIVLEPDKPHSFKITVPAFNQMVDFFDCLSERVHELSDEFNIEELPDEYWERLANENFQ